MNHLRKLFDFKQTEDSDPELLGYANEADVTALFSLLGLLAKSTGVVTKAQINVTQRVMEQHVPAALHNLAKKSFKAGKSHNLVGGMVTRHAFNLYWGQQGRWLEPLQVLDILLRVAYADGTYSELETFIIDTTRKTFGIHVRSYWYLRDYLAERLGVKIEREGESWANAKNQGRYKQKKDGKFTDASNNKVSEPLQDRDGAFAVLGLQAGATPFEIKRAYRTLVKQYHPDKQKQEQLSQSELEKMIRQFCDVQEAYEILTR
jgi:DnaJ like chaperone protein